jgi:hypothetical protein
MAAAAAPWVAGAALSMAPSGEVVLRPESVAAWNVYVTATEARRANEDRATSGFLALDFDPAARGSRRQLLAGQVVVTEVSPPQVAGRDIEVPDATVHHWRGAVFVPGISAHELVDALEREGPDTGQEDVLVARVLERAAGRQRVFLRLQRSRIVTAVYNTEHDVRFGRPAPDRAVSTSAATRIAEVARPGQPDEREQPPGRDRGFLWRWHAYWRYQDVPGGVLVECESLSLSRRVPFVLRYVAGPLIRDTAVESMDRTLVALRARFGAPAGSLP